MQTQSHRNYIEIELIEDYEQLAEINANLQDFKNALLYAKKAVTLKELWWKDPAKIMIRRKHYLKVQVRDNFKINEVLVNEYIDNSDISFNQTLDLLSSYFRMCHYSYKMNDIHHCYLYADKYFIFYMNLRAHLFTQMSTKEKLSFSKSTRTYLSNYLGSAYAYYDKTEDHSKKTEIAKEIYTNWIRYKGSAFDTENILSLLEAEGDSESKTLVEKLKAEKQHYTKLYQQDPASLPNYKQNLHETTQKIESLEQQLSKKVKEFDIYRQLTNITPDEVFDALKEDELFLDFAKGEEYYYLFVLEKRDAEKKISFIKVAPSKEVDEQIKTIREEFETTIPKIPKGEIDTSDLEEKTTLHEALSILYTLLLKKIDAKTPENKSFLISPDSALFHLPFEMLRKEDAYLLESREIGYISSAKELVRLHMTKKAENEKQPPHLFVDPNLPEESSSKDNGTFKGGFHIRGAEKEQKESIQTITQHLQKMRFYKLDHSKEEGEAIQKHFPESKLYEQSNFNETNLFQTTSPRFLHLSTHGFFISDENEPNPMLKSGIVTGFDQENKNIETIMALKLMGLKLQNTELVTISACESGVGEISDGEGVSALSSAFVKAGAQNVLMSLWSVQDEITKEFMSRFYQNVKEGQSYKEATRNAKLVHLKSDVPEWKKHPLFWAPFVINGR